MSTARDHSELGVAAAAQRLMELWDRLANAHTMIGAGCSCGAGGIAVALADFEQDIVDYLQAEGERRNRHDVLSFLAENAREAERWSIAKLLGSLSGMPAQPVSDDVAAFILERLSRTLQSFEKLHGGR